MPRFEDLTETTGTPLSREGAEMMYTRYRVAADLAAGQRVLEIACGSGQGIALIAAQARRVVGGDISLPLLRSGRRHYQDRFSFVGFSADRLPFRAGAFDVVVFFEASYYVPDMDPGFREIGRVLASGGTVLFVNANPERPDFIRSEHSVHYHTADEFRRQLTNAGFSVTVEAAFPVEPNKGRSGRVTAKLVSLARRILERLGLVPKTLRGRAQLKRLVYGRMIKVPSELPEGFTQTRRRVIVGSGPVRAFKVLYVTARKRQ